MAHRLELLDSDDFCRHSETGEIPARGTAGICPQALLVSAQEHHDAGRRSQALAAVKLLGYQPEAVHPAGFRDLRAQVHASLGKP